MPETTKELSGRELNEAIGSAFGFQPSITWEILNADETASMIGFEREAIAIKWLDEHPSLKRTHHVGTWRHWPNFAGSIEAAMQVVEKMRERGWAFQIYIFPESYNVSAFHSGTSNDITEEYMSNVRTRTEDYACRSFAKALCLAALEASGVDAAELFDLNEGNSALAAIGSKE